jgi:Skp family chaperone for outer membrane proteins
VKLIVIILFYFHFLSSSHAENNIIFLDVMYIYNNATAIKNIENEYVKKNKLIQDEISKYETEIRSEEKKLENKKNIISEDILKIELLKLETKVNKYNKIISEKREQLANMKKNINTEFYKQLTNILSNYANKNSIDMIINKEQILVGKTELDSTKEILNEFNNNIKTLSINE